MNIHRQPLWAMASPGGRASLLGSGGGGAEKAPRQRDPGRLLHKGTWDPQSGRRGWEGRDGTRAFTSPLSILIPRRSHCDAKDIYTSGPLTNGPRPRPGRSPSHVLWAELCPPKTR